MCGRNEKDFWVDLLNAYSVDDYRKLLTRRSKEYFLRYMFLIVSGLFFGVIANNIDEKKGFLADMVDAISMYISAILLMIGVMGILFLLIRILTEFREELDDFEAHKHLGLMGAFYERYRSNFSGITIWFIKIK